MSKPLLPITIEVLSDWGVGTGLGALGASHSVIERDTDGKPVIRATVLAGLLREQAAIVADALDLAVPRNRRGASNEMERKTTWRTFVARLFGNAENPRLVSFSEATQPSADTTTDANADTSQSICIDQGDSHDVVSVSIDRSTGTAKKDYLRFFERARKTTLRAEVSLAQFDIAGDAITWSEQQQEAAELILSMAARLVRGVGSNRSDGDGQCRMSLNDTQWCTEKLRDWSGKAAPEPPTASTKEAKENVPEVASAATQPPSSAWYHADLDIDLLTPLVSYDVPMSNEIRSLDFVRGTVLLPWIHHQLRQSLPPSGSKDFKDLVRDAVVNGDLRVSDATAVVDGVRGLPAPVVFSVPKVPGELEFDENAGPHQVATNRWYADKADVPQKPVRSGYVFPVEAGGDSNCPTVHCQDWDEDLPVRAALGAPGLTGRQSAAHDATTGATKNGQLFLVKALPAGLKMRATVTLSKRLYEVVGKEWQDSMGTDASGAEEGMLAQLGSRRLSGNYGRVRCSLQAFAPSAPAQVKWDGAATTLWFTSDVIVRSDSLGPGGSVEDLLRAFEKEGVALQVAPLSDCSPGVIRHRRVDSWSAADHQPRPSRLAIAAGAVVRVMPADGADTDEVMRRLSHLATLGIGELQAQGFGRFVVDHPLLQAFEDDSGLLKDGQFVVRELRSADFVSPNGDQGQQKIEGEVQS